MLNRTGLSACLLAACLAMPSAAHAFSTQNKEAADPYNLPKFDVEEQSKNFQTGSVDSSPNYKKAFEAPLGNGSLYFGVQQGPASGFLTPGGAGSIFGPEFGGVRNGPEDFNRVVTPENLR